MRNSTDAGSTESDSSSGRTVLKTFHRFRCQRIPCSFFLPQALQQSPLSSSHFVPHDVRQFPGKPGNRLECVTGESLQILNASPPPLTPSPCLYGCEREDRFLCCKNHRLFNYSPSPFSDSDSLSLPVSLLLYVTHFWHSGAVLLSSILSAGLRAPSLSNFSIRTTERLLLKLLPNHGVARKG